jgi:solute carrier family 35 protein F5
MTTVSSNTILSSTSGVITLVLSVIFLKETPDLLKFFAALCAFGGVSCIALADKDEGRESLIGDFLAFGGAIVYGCYCVLLKKRAEKVDMVMFFGCVGIMNAFVFSPFFLLLHFTGFETFELPNQLEMSVLILNGLFGTVISDLLWALSVRYLNPALCTIGLSLTIPLSLASDNIIYHKVFNGLYFGGGVLILAGFMIMSLFEHKTISAKISNKGLRKLCSEKEDDKELLEV